MKKLINDVPDVVREQLEGLAMAHPELHVHFDPNFVCRRSIPNGKVALVSGGGSGHEPLHAGFVGLGMLDGACPGEIFTSPTPDQIYECAKEVDQGAGVLFIVKNYTGDVLNFEAAAEFCFAEGMKVQCIVIDDDVSVAGGSGTAGRRGVGTTVCAEKIVGAAAEAGYSFEQCAALCRKVNQHGRSMGLALTSCTVPAAGTPTFDLPEDQVEIGIGIHGEPGVARVSMKQADELVETLMEHILDDPMYVRTARELNGETGEWNEVELVSQPFESGDRFIALINGMGGTPVSELYGVYRKFALTCKKKKLHVARSRVGTYISCLDMQGVSITLVRADDEMIKLWDARAVTPSFCSPLCDTPT